MKNRRPISRRAQMTDQRNGQSSPVDAHERARDFLSEPDVKQLVEGTKHSRYPECNQLLILMMFRHGFRVSEALGIRMDHMNLNESRMWVERLKGSLATGRH